MPARLNWVGGIRQFCGFILLAAPTTAFAMSECSGPDRAARKRTCVVDGDTGWERGEKWRLLDIDTPETDRAECADERVKGKLATDRLRELMAGGYHFDWPGKFDRSGRKLVRVILKNGDDAGQILIGEHLAQSWPNKGNIWCEL